MKYWAIETKRMKTSLDHLPLSRQKHLAYIVRILRDEMEKATAFSSGGKRFGKILKIILFGSHATGKWVYNPGYGYVSDYDILVIVNQQKLVEEYKIWDAAEDRIELVVHQQPINLIVHTLDEVNRALVEGQYFFTDIKREGVLLYQSDKWELKEPGNLTATERRAIAEEHYEVWFESSVEFFDQHKYAFRKEKLKIAAFELHQATEHCYACLLLVLTNYKPYTHNLKQLNALSILQDERIAEVFPQERKVDRRCFQLLKDA